MIIYIEDIQREANILNWYKGEAIKEADATAVFLQSDKSSQDAFLYHLRNVVTDLLLFANANRVKFTCEWSADYLRFTITPLREGREYLLNVLKEAIKQYLVYEIRRLWMMEISPNNADSSLRESLRMNIRETMNNVTAMGKKIRRRYAIMGI